MLQLSLIIIINFGHLLRVKDKCCICTEFELGKKHRVSRRSSKIVIPSFIVIYLGNQPILKTLDHEELIAIERKKFSSSKSLIR